MWSSFNLRFFYIFFLLLLVVGCGSQTEFAAATENPNFSYAIQQAKPAVVLIRAVRERKSKEPVVKGGSGVIISEDGYIVTNNHVIDEANQIQITLDDNRRYTAELIGNDPKTDLALLKIEANSLPYLVFGDSNKLQVGDWILTVGHPLNLPFTVTKGIISAKNRGFGYDKRKIADFIQTDAVINHGNSGGALVNLKGELVGVTSISVTTTGAFIGYSLAIPSAIIQPIINRIKQDRSAQHAVLGILPLSVNDDLIDKKKLKRHYGVYVRKFSKPSAAVDAGMKEGDIIIATNGVKIENLPQLYEQLISYQPEDCVTLTVDRGGEELPISVTLKKALKKNKNEGV
jgi:serine protease Do